MNKKSGFDRLKGVTAASVMGLAGMLGGGSARAASTATGLTVTRGAVVWTEIGNNSSFPSSSSVTTTNGATYSTDTTGFGIADATFSNGTDTFSDAFDNALQLAVDGNLFINPDATIDLTGDTVTSDVVTNIVAGVNAQIQYRFFTSRPVVRALFTLTNTTGSPISVDPVVLSDYGSDTNTVVRSTSDGDTTVENSDFWYITDEDDDDPRILTTRYGTGASVIPTNALTPDGTAPAIAVSGLRYATTIPAGATIRILVFMELSDPDAAPAGAISSARDFDSLSDLQTAGLLAGLGSTEINQIINYGNVAPPSPIATPIFAPVGLLGLIGLIGGAGFFETRRRNRKKV